MTTNANITGKPCPTCFGTGRLSFYTKDILYSDEDSVFSRRSSDENRIDALEIIRNEALESLSRIGTEAELPGDRLVVRNAIVALS